MSAEIIPFVPRANPDRPTLLEEQERKAREFLDNAPALEIMNVALIGGPHENAIYESSPGYIAPEKEDQ